MLSYIATFIIKTFYLSESMKNKEAPSIGFCLQWDVAELAFTLCRIEPRILKQARKRCAPSQVMVLEITAFRLQVTRLQSSEEPTCRSDRLQQKAEMKERQCLLLYV